MQNAARPLLCLWAASCAGGTQDAAGPKQKKTGGKSACLLSYRIWVFIPKASLKFGGIPAGAYP